jgi:Flp pilus assembly protein TadG
MWRRVRGNRGAELIELAMAIPVLLLITAAIFDFGMLFRSWEVVTNAAREGARVGILPAYAADQNVLLRVERYMQVGGVAATCTLQTPSGGTCPPGQCSVCVQTLSVTLVRRQQHCQRVRQLRDADRDTSRRALVPARSPIGLRIAE